MKRLLSILVTLTLTWTVSLAGPTKGSNIDSYYMQLGMDALKNGNVDEAIQSFEKVLQEDSTNGYAHFWIGLGLADEGEVDELSAEVDLEEIDLEEIPEDERSNFAGRMEKISWLMDSSNGKNKDIHM
mgnify:CR=1 FL=1